VDPKTGDGSLTGLRKAYDVKGSGAALLAEASSSHGRVQKAFGKAPEETAEEEPGDEQGLEGEWDDVAARTQKMAAEALSTRGTVPAKEDVSFQNIAYGEVHSWILGLQIDREVLKPYEEEDDDDAGGCGCLSRGSKKRGDVRGLDKRSIWEKDIVLFLKLTDFDFANVTHFRMLRTIYVKLTRSKSCPWIGSHWEVIGFQGGDPRMDLNRSCGLLNVVHMFYFYAHNFDLLKQAWLLSQDQEHHFPLFCISVKLTQMVVHALLRGRLSALCNKASREGQKSGKGDGGLFDTTCRVHTAALFYYYWRWRHQKRTIEDTAETYKEVEELLMRKPAKLLDHFAKCQEEDKQRQDPGKLQFTGLDLGTAGHRDKSPATAKSSIPKRLRNYTSAGGDED